MGFFNNKQQSGFTILELLILIIVIGLVICFYFLKVEIEHHASIKDEISQLKKIESSFQQFKIKYDGIPGDLRDAKHYWKSTKSGNGDFTIRTLENRFSDEYTYGGEMSHVFEQLSLAGFVSKDYDSSFILN